MKKSLVLIAALSSVALAESATLEEAFKNGKISGDISAYYESRHVDKGEKSTYFNNTAWAVGSVGLKYETDYFKGFKTAIGFRGAAPLYEDDKNFDTGHGKGDSTERIYDNSRYLISDLYLEYNAYDTIVRVGRQEMGWGNIDWITRTNDAVRIINNSISNLTIDAVWTRARGKVLPHEMCKPVKKNNDDGTFYVGANYKFDNGLALAGYGMYADDVFSGAGGKIKYNGMINDDIGVGGMAHYAQTDEKKDVADGKIFESTAYMKHKDTKFTLGFVKTGKKNGWGSFGLNGDAIVWFEEGDVMYEKDVKTYYAMIGTKLQKLSIDAIVGTTEYKLKGGDDTKYRQSEFSTWLSYPIIDSLNAFCKFDKTFKEQKYYPAMTQVSVGLSYTF